MSRFQALTQSVGEEVVACLTRINDGEARELLEAILAADRVFVAGAGRSGLAIRAFAMRLAHLGQTVHVVGEITTPPIAPGDLLLIGSGSGRTPSLLGMADTAAAVGAPVALITIDRQSPLAERTQTVMVIPAPSPKAQDNTGALSSVQPMGSLFEQCMWLALDAIVVALMDRLNLMADDMFKRHANLE